ncbi:MAG TPA: hypothetical protein PKC67_15645 [Kiritimatiellia bacterium]|nr:hypothetical protein [Kiritimatiellia bacterium]
MKTLLACLLLLAASPVARAADPTVAHAPVTTALRGVPVKIAATVEPAPGTTVTSAVVLVRLTDAGTPIRTPLTGSGDGAYSAVLPVSMFRSVSVFWYALDLRDDQGGSAGTPWLRVVIADPIEQGGSGAAAASALDAKTVGLVAGGLLLAGGAAVLIANQDDDDDRPANPDPAAPPPPPRSGGSSSGDGGGSSPPDLSILTNVVCQTTGRETVSYQNFSRCEGTDDILILICNTCRNADIRATASWGEQDQRSDFTNLGCNTGATRLRIPKPITAFPSPGSEVVNVYVNDVLVDSSVWPPLSDNDCY